MSTATVADFCPKTGFPVDEYGHLLDEDGGSYTDPYDECYFAIGSGDDFFCFDYTIANHWLILHSVFNSETGHYIEDHDYVLVDLLDPCGYDYQAHQMVSESLDALCMWGQDIKHSKRGWNQDPWHLARAVHLAVAEWQRENTSCGPAAPTWTITDRQKRFGGKKINAYCHI